MGFFSGLASSFMEGWRNGQQGTQSSVPPQYDDLTLPISSGYDFENRLLRARTEPLRFLRQCLMDGRCVSADVHNDQSGGTYRVTAQSCECEDFVKRGQPCKHMIFFAIKTGDFRRYEKRIPPPPPQKYNGGNFIPFYGRYYSGPPTGIPFPFFVAADDVSALLTRHQEERDDICPSGLFSMATARRVGVSYFAAPQSVAAQIWYCSAPADLAALFCYAAYCRELGCEIGCAPLSYSDGLFQSFSPTQKQQLDYIKHFTPTFPIRSMS